MYLSSRTPPPSAAIGAPPAQEVSGPGDGRNVVHLGLTSMFTDLSSEMVTAVLPLYLTIQLGLTPLEFGAFDGIYQALTSVLGLTGALAADRWRRHKEVATVGYGLSAGCRMGLLGASGAWAPTVMFLYLDRLGKGLRTAPRDALISLSATPARMAEAFGLHRAFDTLGALLGPVVAFLVLRLVPGGYDAVFVVSFCAALVGVGVLTLFVSNPAAGRAAKATKRAAGDTSVRSLIGLLQMRRFRAVVLAGTLVSLVTLSDAFLYLTFQRRSSLSTAVFPLLYAGSALAYLVLAVPMGRVADRVGRTRVFLAGHLLMVGAYVSLMLEGPLVVRGLVLVALLGTYYAATAGVLMAIVGSIVPPQLRAIGIGVLVTCIAVARLGAALVFGALWTRWDSKAAVAALAVGMLVSIIVSTPVLRSSQALDRA